MADVSERSNERAVQRVICVLDRYFQVQGFDLLDEIFLVVDHMSCSHAFAGVDGFFSRGRRHNCGQVEDVAGHLDGSAADASSTIDLFCVVVNQL